MDFLKLNEQLSESTNPYYGTQTLFKALKSTPKEAQKIMVKFFQKKGVHYPHGVSSHINGTPITYKEHSGKWKPEEIAELESWGWTLNAINKVKRMKTDRMINALTNSVGYGFNADKTDQAAFKKEFDQKESSEKDRIINKAITNAKQSRDMLHKDIMSSYEPAFSLFSAENNRSGLKSPVLKFDNQEFKFEINSNETFFEDGHDVTITMYGDKEDNDPYKSPPSIDYKYKINILQPVQLALNDLWTLIEKAMDEFKIDDYTEDESGTVELVRDRKNEAVEQFRKLFSKWYSKTKTGKLKEVSIDRMPAELFINVGYYSNSNYNKPDERQSSHKGMNEYITISLRMKAGNWSYNNLIKAHPKIVAWHEIYSNFFKSIGAGMHPGSIKSAWEDKRSFNEEHDKFWKRFELAIKRLMQSGYYPVQTDRSHKRGDMNKIIFKHNPKVAEKIKDDPAWWERFKNTEHYKSRIQVMKSEGTREEDIPRWYVKTIFELESRR